jgi:hypothetical protein
MTRLEFKHIPIRGIFRWFDQKSLAVPEIQREFVWNAKRACTLLDSIYRGYPIGTVMIWRAHKSLQTLLRHKQNVLPAFDDTQNKEILFLLDGQQRLSVLHNIREGRDVNNASGREISFGSVYFSLEKDLEEAFLYIRRPDPEVHFAVVDLLRGNCRPKAAYKRKLLAEARQRILSYRLAVTFTNTPQIEQVRQTFIRINAQGMRIGEADKAFSQAQDVTPLDRYRNLVAHMTPGFSGIKKELYLRTIMLAQGNRSLGQKGLGSWSRDIMKSEESRKWFASEEPKIQKAIRYACDYLKKEFLVQSLSFLPSENMIAVMAQIFYARMNKQPSAIQAKQIRLWFWHTGATSRYSGASYEKNIVGDAAILTKVALGKRASYTVAERDPLHKIRHSTYNSGAALARSYRLLLMQAGPRYLDSGTLILLDGASASGNSKQLHHIFPRAILKRIKVPIEQQNALANICYLSADDNQHIGGRSPADYLKPFARKSFFTRMASSHFIPSSKTSPLWKTPSKATYRLFLEGRSRMIAAAFSKEAGAIIFE